MNIGIPDFEARLRAQESMSTIFHARLHELHRDMTLSFKQNAEYQLEQEKRVDARFNKIDQEIAGLKTDVVGLKTDVAGLKTDVTDLKVEVAEIKTNMSAMEQRILDAFRQLLTIIDARLPAKES